MGTFLVTGANRGIGLQLCRLLRARSDDVIAVCRRSSPELEGLDGVRIESGLDLGQDAVTAELAARLAGARIDAAILNAGILRPDRLDGLAIAGVREQIEVNTLGPLRVILALLPCLPRGGKLALITSRMGSIADNGSGGYYGYRASKAGLNALGVSLAHDLAPRGVSVAILHPGFVRTEMTGHNGNVEPEVAAEQLLARLDALGPETSGRFLHANGEPLPW